MRRPVLYGMLGAMAWFGVVLFAWQKYGWSNRFLAVPIALAPFVGIFVWVRRNPT